LKKPRAKRGFFILDEKVRKKKIAIKKIVDGFFNNFVYVIDEGGESEFYF